MDVALLERIVEAAREFPEADSAEIFEIARKRTERANNRPFNPSEWDTFENRALLLGWGKHSTERILARCAGLE